MGRYEMIVAIVAIVMFATVLKARYGYRRRRDDSDTVERADDGEAARLREEVKQLKERIHVLERITTERENSLSREIEELRDR
jgi:phage shock protein B